MSVTTLLLIVLVLILLGSFPIAQNQGWGYGPSGILGLVLVVFLVLFLTHRI